MRFWYRYKVWVVPGLNCQRTHLFARDTLMYKLAICSKYKLQRLAPCVIILIASINHQLASSPLSSLQLDSDATQGNNGQKTIFQTSHLVSKPYLRPIFFRLFKEWEKVFGAAVVSVAVRRSSDRTLLDLSRFCIHKHHRDWRPSQWLSNIPWRNNWQQKWLSEKLFWTWTGVVWLHQGHSWSWNGCAWTRARCDEFCIFGVEPATTVTWSSLSAKCQIWLQYWSGI